MSCLSTTFCARLCGQNTWLPRPCRHVNRAASDASVSLSPASSPGHVSSFLLHALRLREPAQIAEIKRLASGAVTPLYRRATNEGIQLFLAGSAGLLQTTEDVRFEPCPGLTAAGRGVVSPENIAFTRWLTHLQDGVLLDEQNCLMLHELWLQSGTGRRRWEELPDDARESITALFTPKRGDWCDIWSNEDVSVWWNRLCDNVLPEKPCRLTC